MSFGSKGDKMCGKDCDGAFAEYIAVPSGALVCLPPSLLSPYGAFLEPVAAALAPLKYVNGLTCIYGGNRIAELTCQVARVMGNRDIERITRTADLQKDHYDCIIETEPFDIETGLPLKNKEKPAWTDIFSTVMLKGKEVGKL